MTNFSGEVYSVLQISNNSVILMIKSQNTLMQKIKDMLTTARRSYCYAWTAVYECTFQQWSTPASRYRSVCNRFNHPSVLINFKVKVSSNGANLAMMRVQLGMHDVQRASLYFEIFGTSVHKTLGRSHQFHIPLMCEKSLQAEEVAQIHRATLH